MNNAGLGCVVCSLHLWDIDNMSTHTCRSDETTICVILELLSVKSRSLFLLASPVVTCGTGAVESAVEIRGDDFAVVVDLAIEHGTLRPRDTSIGNEDVETAVEFLDNGINCFDDCFVRRCIYLVCLA